MIWLHIYLRRSYNAMNILLKKKLRLKILEHPLVSLERDKHGQGSFLLRAVQLRCCLMKQMNSAYRSLPLLTRSSISSRVQRQISISETFLRDFRIRIFSKTLAKQRWRNTEEVRTTRTNKLIACFVISVYTEEFPRCKPSVRVSDPLKIFPSATFLVTVAPPEWNSRKIKCYCASSLTRDSSSDYRRH